MNKEKMSYKKSRILQRIPVSPRANKVMKPKKGKGSYDRKAWKQ